MSAAVYAHVTLDGHERVRGATSEAQRQQIVSVDVRPRPRHDGCQIDLSLPRRGYSQRLQLVVGEPRELVCPQRLAVFGDCDENV